jgi:hypothetical protein
MMTNSIPKRLGKYEIVGEIGRGGFAAVYEAVEVMCLYQYPVCTEGVGFYSLPMTKLPLRAIIKARTTLLKGERNAQT